MTPALLKSKPSGSVSQVMLHEYGGVPPDAASVCKYAAPTVPSGSVAVVTLTVGETTVIASALVTFVPRPSASFAVKLKVPRFVGVPVRSPRLSSESPSGNAPLNKLHEYGARPPAPVNACE